MSEERIVIVTFLNDDGEIGTVHRYDNGQSEALFMGSWRCIGEDAEVIQRMRAKVRSYHGDNFRESIYQSWQT